MACVFIDLGLSSGVIIMIVLVVCWARGSFKSQSDTQTILSYFTLWREWAANGDDKVHCGGRLLLCVDDNRALTLIKEDGWGSPLD